MKVAVFYYSATGNTKLACQYVSRKLAEANLALLDITKVAEPDLAGFDLVGFASFTDFWGPPFLMQRFIERLPQQTGKPAFLFFTHGGSPGNMLKTFAKLVSARGFTVVGGHGLRAPESFPPAVARGRTSAEAPNEREMLRFDEFIADLNRIVDSLAVGRGGFVSCRVRISLLARLLPAIDRTRAKKNMGVKSVDRTKCTDCGICVETCPYGAVTLSDKPIFDESKCYGCWACYSKCPTRAIYTPRLHGKGHYPKPLARLQQKLSGDLP
jgi:ferredoxin/flavodoxin